MTVALKIQNLEKLYSKQNGIKNISLNIEEGQVCAFLGPSGSGKTTLIKSILNLLKPDKGNVFFYGEKLQNNYEDIMSIVGYLPDKSFSLPKLTAEDFLAYTNKFYPEDYQQERQSLAKFFNFDLNKKIAELSSGELQVLNLIYAFYHQPRLLFLDEPTNFLDTKTVDQLLTYLKRLKSKNTTIVICSHHMSFINKIADKIYLLKNGEITNLEKDNLKADYKKVSLILDKYLNYTDFDFKGISNLSIDNMAVNFIYSGELPFLLKKLATYPICDIAIEAPTIEEIIGDLL